MIEILRELLDVRHKLGRIENMLLEYGWLDALQPDFRAMQDLERSISQRVNDWDRPDPLAATPAPRETETVPEPLRDGTKSEDASLQAAALNNFDTVWNALKTACSDPSLGAAGQRCISDRQQGSCAYKVSPGGWQNGVYVYNGPNGSGSSCWNWFVGYRDPIANDPTVVPDPTPTSPSASSNVAAGGNPISAVLGSGFNFSSLILPAAVIGGGLLVAALVD